jgi:phosphate transport system substrate-binding protein
MIKYSYEAKRSVEATHALAAGGCHFAGSNTGLFPEVRSKTPDAWVLPVLAGAVAVGFNLPDLANHELMIPREVLADIFLGKVARWNDPAIKALNPDVALPDAAIAQVRRADGSGTTFIFTNYLSKVSPEWKTKVGEGTAVNWPVGAGGKGNEGVAAFVGRLPNSLGYVEYSYVKQNKMTYAIMQNAAGHFVKPEDDTFKAAAAGADWNKSFYQILTNQQGKEAWPISGATYILMHTKQDKPANATEALKFFNWAYANGEKAAADLDYVPMPPAVVGAIQKAWGEIKDASGKAVAFK